MDQSVDSSTADGLVPWARRWHQVPACTAVTFQVSSLPFGAAMLVRCSPVRCGGRVRCGCRGTPGAAVVNPAKAKAEIPAANRAAVRIGHGRGSQAAF